MAKRRKTKKRGRKVEQVITTRDRLVFDGRRPRPDPFAPRRFEPLEPPTAPEAMARRRRAVFTTTPPIFPHPTREFFHRGNRPPFPQPAPHDLQGLGSAEDVHTEEGTRSLNDAHEFAFKAANLADEGDCHTARRFLNAAHGAIGHAVAHSGSGGRIPYITVSASTVDRAEEHYAARCPVKRRK